jgi:hypothetical protein
VGETNRALTIRREVMIAIPTTISRSVPNLRESCGKKNIDGISSDAWMDQARPIWSAEAPISRRWIEKKAYCE